MVAYETAQSVPLGRRGSSALARLDHQVVSQASLRARGYLWKVYTAGSLRDDAFVARLQVEDRLRQWTDGQPRGYGFQRAGKHEGQVPSQTLCNLRSLAEFNSWGPLKEGWFESIPFRVKRVPNERLFGGRRLLVRRGVSPGFGPHARLETEPLAFRHTTYALSLEHLAPWQAKVILGTLLSSLGRYWLYMVSGSWGTWRDEVRSSDLLDLPLRLPSTPDSETRRIGQAVDELQHIVLQRRPGRASAPAIPPEVMQPMRRIDEGVADLFELTHAERELVVDFWMAQGPSATFTLPDSAPASGTEVDLNSHMEEGIGPYLRVFLSAWNRRLGDRGGFGWRVWRDPHTRVVAVIFETREIGVDSSTTLNGDADEDWSAALRRLGAQWEASQTHSILRYGMVRAVTETAIVIVKRDERHLWTATAARQDIDATTAQVMSIERQ